MSFIYTGWRSYHESRLENARRGLRRAFDLQDAWLARYYATQITSATHALAALNESEGE